MVNGIADGIFSSHSSKRVFLKDFNGNWILGLFYANYKPLPNESDDTYLKFSLNAGNGNGLTFCSFKGAMRRVDDREPCTVLDVVTGGNRTFITGFCKTKEDFYFIRPDKNGFYCVYCYRGLNDMGIDTYYFSNEVCKDSYSSRELGAHETIGGMHYERKLDELGFTPDSFMRFGPENPLDFNKILKQGPKYLESLIESEKTQGRSR
jgi:hypothetical protein